METQDAQTSSLVVYGELQRARTITDKALVIEKEVGTEIIYTLISLGKNIADIADSLGLTEDEMKLIMCRTVEHRSKYMKALMFAPAEVSVVKLSELSNKETLNASEGRASAHHQKMIDMLLTHTRDTTNDGSAITVNNTVVVSSKESIPQVPDELRGMYKDVSFE